MQETVVLKNSLFSFSVMPLVLKKDSIYLDGDTPAQKGGIFELREHQEEALANLVKMREDGKTIALVQGATGSSCRSCSSLIVLGMV